MSELSPAEWLVRHNVHDQFVGQMEPAELSLLPYIWPFWARPKQLAPPGNWSWWLALAGRGFGKTRMICEWANHQALLRPGSRGAIVAATAGDVRDVLIEGGSGILAISAPGHAPLYEPSKRRLTWPNGSQASLFSADQPDRLRGPQFHWSIVDELAAWRYPAAWDMLQFGVRLGENPQTAIATTPRPVSALKALLADPACLTVRGTTYENAVNLARPFLNTIVRRYEGTRIGRQELMAELLDDVPGALWNRAVLDSGRVSTTPELRRIVVAIDPAASTGQTGIVVVGAGKLGRETHFFVMEDCTPAAGTSPAGWGLAAVAAYNKFSANLMVAETNHGGDMVANVIRNVPGGAEIAFQQVRASRGKYTRAEPVAALWEQGRGHCLGFFDMLEDELCSWLPGHDSPNRLDALVWGVTVLLSDSGPEVAPAGVRKTSSWRF